MTIPQFCPATDRPRLVDTSGLPQLRQSASLNHPSIDDFQQWEAIRTASVGQQLDTYIDLAKSSLSRALLVSQRNAALRWMELSSDTVVRDIIAASAMSSFLATQAISNIAPSRTGPSSVKVVDEQPNALVIDGVARWVTGATLSDYIVIGIEKQDRLQSVALVDKNAEGVSVQEHQGLGVLQDSDTGQVSLKHVKVSRERLLVPFEEDIVTKRAGVIVRGYPALTTTALAVGHALGSCAEVQAMSNVPAFLLDVCHELVSRANQLKHDMASLALVKQVSEHTAHEALRARANACAIASADLLSIASRGSALLRGSIAEQRLLESRFLLGWAMSPGCQQRTVWELLHIRQDPYRE